eukprot:TRINITY_DN10485_c1_g1_i1.p1 TRINITY_DN10485_c1_g1~~TRINITY_DN10485_c1_g1_i1.p1  ORF type:complete len:736 (-),score=149.49 TRINITY_DN10485_c1_g1_i1:104-2311(-)
MPTLVRGGARGGVSQFGCLVWCSRVWTAWSERTEGLASWTAPLFDYDCVSVKAPSLIDWSELHAQVQQSVELARKGGKLPRPPPLSGRVFLGHRDRALKECPLAVLNLAIIHYYTALNDPAEQEEFRELVLATAESVGDTILRSFPVHVVCSSRWPVFETLELFALDISAAENAAKLQADLTCDDQGDGVVDWQWFRMAATAWARSRLLGVGSQEVDDLEADVQSLILHVLQLKDTSVAKAECVFGFAFVVGSGALSAATRLTQYFTLFNQELDRVVEHSGFRLLALSGWPVASSLAWLSDANKGKKYAKRDPKYVRRYGDLDLRPEELSPMVQPPTAGGAVAAAWRKRGAQRAAVLRRTSWHRFESRLRQRMRRGKPRPILQRAFVATLAATREATVRSRKRRRSAERQSSRQQGTRVRRAVGLALLYGSSWSVLLERIVRHFGTIGFTWPLLIVSIGRDAADACRGLAMRDPSEKGPRVFCWRPDTESQMHRFTIVHILLHLGVDVFYFDMDTFFFKNPLPIVLAEVKKHGLDTLFASHADGDCINIGMFFIRSTSRSTVWFSQFLGWYHDHQYEIDQRGLDILMGSPRRSEKSELGVSFPPKALTKIRAGVLEDWNEFVIGFIGWAGEISRMTMFHWCNIRLKRKWAELSEVYEAAEALEETMPLQLALDVVSPTWQPPFREPSDDPPFPPKENDTQGASSGTSHVWSLVRRARHIFEAYRLPAVPPRGICW